MAAKYDLSATEQRVLGCLLEKEITTPDQYPLSLNGLTNACNQKSNREPVMDLSEADVQDTLNQLKEKRLIASETGFGSRVIKYRHRFCNTEFGELKLSPQALGIICVMLLRGPQTPGELRTRTNRLCEFTDVSEVELTLSELADRGGDPFVVKLEREPGKRESRYAHLLGDGEVVDAAPSVSAEVVPDSAVGQVGNLTELEQRVALLESQVKEALARIAVLEGAE